MSRMSDAMVSCWQAGAVPVDMTEVLAWRAEGHAVPIQWVPATGWNGQRVPVAAIAADTAVRLAGALDDEHARARLAAAVDDLRDYAAVGCEITVMERRSARSCVATGRRLAGEIVASVTAGNELPEEWYRYDAYAEIGEPTACEVVRIVREELEGTGIRV